MIHDVPAKSKLVPVVPITSPQFVYRRARDTDVRLTFARAQSAIESASLRYREPTAEKAGKRS